MRCQRCGHRDTPDNHLDTVALIVNGLVRRQWPVCVSCRADFLGPAIDRALAPVGEGAA